MRACPAWRVQAVDVSKDTQRRAGVARRACTGVCAQTSATPPRDAPRAFSPRGAWLTAIAPSLFAFALRCWVVAGTQSLCGLQLEQTKNLSMFTRRRAGAEDGKS